MCVVICESERPGVGGVRMAGELPSALVDVVVVVEERDAASRRCREAQGARTAVVQGNESRRVE
jgi:hypothetical protein